MDSFTPLSNHLPSLAKMSLNREGVLRHYLSPTYNIVLSSLPRRLINHSHLGSPSPSNPHDGRLSEQPTSGDSETQHSHVSLLTLYGHTHTEVKTLHLPSSELALKYSWMRGELSSVNWNKSTCLPYNTDWETSSTRYILTKPYFPKPNKECLLPKSNPLFLLPR